MSWDWHHDMIQCPGHALDASRTCPRHAQTLVNLDYIWTSLKRTCSTKDGAEPILASFSGTSLVTSAFVSANQWGHKVRIGGITNTRDCLHHSPLNQCGGLSSGRGWETIQTMKVKVCSQPSWTLSEAFLNPSTVSFPPNSGVTILFLYYVVSHGARAQESH